MDKKKQGKIQKFFRILFIMTITHFFVLLPGMLLNPTILLAKSAHHSDGGHQNDCFGVNDAVIKLQEISMKLSNNNAKDSNVVGDKGAGLTRAVYALMEKINNADFPNAPSASEVGTVADNGATTPMYASVREAAFYNALLDTTVFAWEAFVKGKRQAHVSTYDHSMQTFGPIINSGIPGLINDDHGVPAVLQDHQGFGHLFGGSHAASMQHAVTNSPNDFSSFTVAAPIEGEYGYPHPVLVDDKIFLFMRRGRTGYTNLVLRKTDYLNNGDAQWAEERTIINLGEDPESYTNRVYAGNFVVVGTEIWFIAQLSPATDEYRKNVYFFKYDSVSGNVKNYDGSVVVNSEDLPVCRIEADANFLIYEHEGADRGTDIPVWFLDDENRAHIFFGVGPNDGPFSIIHMYDTGKGWSDPEIAAVVSHRYDVFAPVFLLDGSIELYYPSSIYNSLYDGDMMLKTRSISGEWSCPQKIIESDQFLTGRVLPVLNGHPDAMVIFAELANNRFDNSAGSKRIFIYGENGFLSREMMIPTNISLPTVSGILAPGEALVGTVGEWDAYPSELTFSFQWFADGEEIAGATNSILTLSQEETGAEISFKVTASNKVGSGYAFSSAIKEDVWIKLADIPGAPVYNGVPRLVDTDGDYIYSGSADLTTEFWGYSIVENNWTRMTDAPDTFQNYTSSVYAGGEYIYVTRGIGCDIFWRYSIADDSWDALADIPVNLGIGSHSVYGGGDFIYLRQGSTAKVLRYSISNNAWADPNEISDAPGPLMWSELVCTGENYIYALQGNANKAFWRYSIPDNLWTIMAPAPGNVKSGSSLSYSGGDYIYAFQGNNSNAFWRYSIAADSWETLMDTPEAVNWGGSSVYMNGYIYLRVGNGGSSFYRYTAGN